MCVAITNATALAAVDRHADKVSLGELSRCRAGWGRVRDLGFEPLGRAGAKDLGHVTVWTCASVFEDDVRERHGTKVTASARVWHPRRRGIHEHAADRVGTYHVRQRVGRRGPYVVNEVGPIL